MGEKSIKQQLTDTAKIIFGDKFIKIAKKDNVYNIYINRNWDTNIVQDIRNGKYESWGNDLNIHLENHDEFVEQWNIFTKDAYAINPDFGKGYNDSDRGFVPRNYLFYKFSDY